MKIIDLDEVETKLAEMFTETPSAAVLRMVIDFLKLKLSSKKEVGRFDMDKFMEEGAK